MTKHLGEEKMISRILAGLVTIALLCGTPELSAQSREGIQVRGHWVLVVKNPDGTVAARSEFDNALQPSGAATLTQLLTRQRTFGGWLIRYASFLDTASFSNNPFGSDGGISEPNVAVVGTSLTLTAQKTAIADGTLRYVSTAIYTCEPTVAPANCPASLGGVFFTATAVPQLPTMTMVKGQILQTTVTISFSEAPHAGSM